MKDDSVVKSFRVPESMFEQANEIFKKEGFSASEVIRVLFNATIREGRIPRGLATREMESQSDAAKIRKEYMDNILARAVPGIDGKSAEDRLLECIFGREETVSEMSNASIRDWASRWGLPDTLSVATLADLYESGMFGRDPWGGVYDGMLEETEDFSAEDALFASRENLKHNLGSIMTELEVRSLSRLLQDYHNREEEQEYA